MGASLSAPRCMRIGTACRSIVVHARVFLGFIFKPKGENPISRNILLNLPTLNM